MFDGWGLSMWEKVAIYRYVYGLNPFGPHRPLADHWRVYDNSHGMRRLLAVGDQDREYVLDGDTWFDFLRSVENG